MIIGITGLAGSGKDTAADYLKELGFSFYSCSDIIREECAKRGLETTRENLIKIGNELREKFGNDYLACEILKKMGGSKSRRSVVVSIRHHEEVKRLKQGGDFKMIFINAPLEVRYARTQNRNQNRPEDRDSYDKFKENEEREKAGTGNRQQIDLVIKMADDTIMNCDSLEDLRIKIEELLKKYEKTKQEN